MNEDFCDGVMALREAIAKALGILNGLSAPQAVNDVRRILLAALNNGEAAP